MEEIKIKVVVPIYKVEKYLRRCVDSILTQTYSNFVLVLVDDGSPDNCPSICDEYCAKDSRVFVIHQVNQGLSAARNAGIEYSCDCNYITFIDSDDWVHPMYLETLAEGVRMAPISMILFDRYNDKVVIDNENLKPKLWNLERCYVEHHACCQNATGKLFPIESFDGIGFPIGKTFEAGFTTWKVLFKYDSIAVISEPLYFYYTNPNSITMRKLTGIQWDRINNRVEQLEYFTDGPIHDKLIDVLFWIIDYNIQNSEGENFNNDARRVKRKFCIKYKNNLGFNRFCKMYLSSFRWYESLSRIKHAIIHKT